MNHHLDIQDEENTGGTIQFSLEKTKHVDLKKPSESVAQELSFSEEEEELLKSRAVPTEFEDIFSDSQIEEEGTGAVEGVVAIEEVFKQKADMINEDFHNETGEAEREDSEEQEHPKLRKAAIIIGIVSAAVILAAIALAVIILL